MNTAIFVGFVLFFALAIWGRTLREEAFRSLTAEQRASVTDKVPNYTATEMIPFAGAILALVWLLLFWPEWLRAGASVCLSFILVLVGAFHVRARRRFRALGLPGAFLERYEKSRIVSYSALAVPMTVMLWILFL